MATLPLANAITDVLVKLEHQDQAARMASIHHPNRSEEARRYVVSWIGGPPSDFHLQYTNLVLTNTCPTQWQMYMFGLLRDWTSVFGHLNEKVRNHARILVQGLRFFDQRRRASVKTNSFPEFLRLFAIFSRGALVGLDFKNLFVAGGSVLACVTENEFDSSGFSGSDVDIFIYGLKAREATAKVKHIEDTIRANVPDFENTYAVEVTITTISFVPKATVGPFRKIQVILRLHSNPGEILGSFDMDQTAMGFDGKDVWIEFRAARALFTGYTFVTAKFLQLASTARISKYALRGYGLVVRVGGRADESSISLATRLAARATEAHNWVRHQVFLQQNAIPPPLMARRATNFSALLSLARATISGSWLDTFSGFAMLAALWDHAAAHDETLEQFARGLLKRQIPYTVGDRFDYDELTNNTLVTLEDWDQAVITALQRLGRLERVVTPPLIRIWAVTGAKSVEQALSLPLIFYVFLPADSLDILRTCGGSAFRKHLHAVEGVPHIKDGAGHDFELCQWSIETENMWRPAKGMPRFIHEVLRDATISSAWSLRRASIGALWASLNLGKVMERHLKNARTPISVLEDFRKVVVWYQN